MSTLCLLLSLLALTASTPLPVFEDEVFTCVPHIDLAVLSIKNLPMFLCTSPYRSFVLAATIPHDNTPITVAVNPDTITKLTNAYISRPDIKSSEQIPREKREVEAESEEENIKCPPGEIEIIQDGEKICILDELSNPLF